MQNYADFLKDFAQRHATGLTVAAVAGKSFLNRNNVSFRTCFEAFAVFRNIFKKGKGICG